MAALMAMLGCYVVVVLASHQLSARAVLGAIAALYAIVLLAPPLISTDIFSYQSYSRMGAVYGVSPYLNGPHGIAQDPLFYYVGAKWAYMPSVYGPVFTTLSYLFAPLSIVASVLAYKLIAAVSALAIVDDGLEPCPPPRGRPRARGRAGRPEPAARPLRGRGGHNDLLMLVPVVGAIYATVLGRERLSGGLTVLGIGIKLTAGPARPSRSPRAARCASGGRRRELLISFAVGGFALIALGLGVFGAGVFHMFATCRRARARVTGTASPA